MSTYLKHMGGYTYKQLKGKSFDEIQMLFDKEMKRVNTFVAMGSEVQKEKKQGRRERTTERILKETKCKKKKSQRKMTEVMKPRAKEALRLKRNERYSNLMLYHLLPKIPVIIDLLKLHKEGYAWYINSVIRADGSSKRNSSIIRMLQE
ncbi:hypothetical protein Tco_0994692 [Tanacetum coccineum]